VPTGGWGQSALASSSATPENTTREALPRRVEPPRRHYRGRSEKEAQANRPYRPAWSPKDGIIEADQRRRRRPTSPYRSEAEFQTLVWAVTSPENTTRSSPWPRVAPRKAFSRLLGEGGAAYPAPIVQKLNFRSCICDGKPSPSLSLRRILEAYRRRSAQASEPYRSSPECAVVWAERAVFS